MEGFSTYNMPFYCNLCQVFYPVVGKSSDIERLDILDIIAQPLSTITFDFLLKKIDQSEYVARIFEFEERLDADQVQQLQYPELEQLRSRMKMSNLGWLRLQNRFYCLRV